jgi:hypothetical protein
MFIPIDKSITKKQVNIKIGLDTLKVVING